MTREEMTDIAKIAATEASRVMMAEFRTVLEEHARLCPWQHKLNVVQYKIERGLWKWTAGVLSGAVVGAVASVIVQWLL